MFVKVAIGLTVILVLFLGYVSTREGKFRYERSGVINAPAEKIYPYISQLKLGGEWSPYEKKDPNMKKAFSGTDGSSGAKLDFDGNAQAGSGSVEILTVTPNQGTDLKLIMTKPMYAENLIEYRLQPEGDGTRFSWAMSGDSGFMGKFVNTIIDCEKMIGGDMELGIQNLKTIVESQK